jgi:hypothetical protein
VRILVALLLLASCGRRATEADRRRVLCVQETIRVGESPLSRGTLGLWRDACFPAFGPRFKPPAYGTSHPAIPWHRWSHFMRGSDLACSEQAAVVAPLQWHRLLAICGREHFAVPVGLEPFFSESWYVGQRIGAWLVATRNKGGAEQAWRAFFERAGAGRFPLEYPLHMPGLYTLPGSATASVDGGNDGAHLIVLADRALAGKAPRFRLEPAGMDPIIEGFPGSPVPPDQLAGWLSRAPIVIAPRDLPAARLFEVLDATRGATVGLLVAAQGLRPVVHMVPLSEIAGRRGELGGKTVDDLVLALDAIERQATGPRAPPPQAPPKKPVRPIN